MNGCTGINMAEKDIAKATKSLCPKCLAVIDAKIYKKNGKIRIRKLCKEHGEFDEIYWSDADLYEKFKQWRPWHGCDSCENLLAEENVLTSKQNGCPFDCGLCPEHKSTTMLAILDLTNRCDKRCDICFANAAVTGYLYEPTFEQVKQMMQMLRNEKPPCPAIQFAGGEPTMRKDFVEIVKLAKRMGFAHIQVATNGKRMSRDLKFCQAVKDAGLHTVYLQFDGFDPKLLKRIRGYNDLWEKLGAIENCRKAGIKSIILVPTVVKNQNSRQLDQIINFAAEHLDIIRGVNFQPISFCGRTEDAERELMRITIPELLDEIEEQTNRQIKKRDFYPVPFVLPISRFVQAWKGEPQLKFSVHEHCGAATFVFVQDGRFIPITEFLDVEGFMAFLDNYATTVNRTRLNKIRTSAKFLWSLGKFFKTDRAPHGFSTLKLLANVLGMGNRDSVAEFVRKSLFIGVMHFMDPYNYDLDRVRRCGIHYVTPDGRIIPFCSYNAIHRSLVEQKFAKPLRKSK